MAEEEGATLALAEKPPAMRPAKEVIAEAQEKAKAVAKVIEQARLAIPMGSKKYVQVEGWNTLAAQYNLVPDIEWTRPVEGGGFEARAILRHIFTGQVVSHAEAECGTPGDAERWIESPHFAQRSMAQTRAVSKVCRLALSWVMVLAGYEPTPAEEMDGIRPGQPSEELERTISLKYRGECYLCGGYLAAGSIGVLSLKTKKVRHPVCPEGPDAAPDDAPAEA